MTFIKNCIGFVRVVMIFTIGYIYRYNHHHPQPFIRSLIRFFFLFFLSYSQYESHQHKQLQYHITVHITLSPIALYRYLGLGTANHNAAFLQAPSTNYHTFALSLEIKPAPRSGL